MIEYVCCAPNDLTEDTIYFRDFRWIIGCVWIGTTAKRKEFLQKLKTRSVTSTRLVRVPVRFAMLNL